MQDSQRQCCGNCASPTQVTLLQEDIDRLLMMGYYDVVFCVEDEGVRYLRKYSNGECVFLKNGQCDVWDRRPSRCQVEAPEMPELEPVVEEATEIVPEEVPMSADALEDLLMSMAAEEPQQKQVTPSPKWF